MARVLSVLTLVLFVAAGTSAAPARAADDRVVVRFAESVSSSQREAARRQARARVLHAVAPLDGVQVVRVPTGDAAQAAGLLQRRPGVLWAQPDHRVRMTAPLPAGGASRAPRQWGLLNTGQSILGQPGVSGIDGGFTTAWDTTLGDESQEIAVVDTGVDFSLADLAANRGPGSYDFVDGDTDPAPAPPDAPAPSEASHGTHVAGIAAAALAVNQPTGDIVGGAPGARIVALRALDADGSGWSSDIAAAFAWAADHGARVGNASLSGIGPSSPVADAIAA